MREFNLEKAKAGYPICTRDGHSVRVICWDFNNGHSPIIALIKDERGERIGLFDSNGDGLTTNLMMAPVKREGWVNIYKETNGNVFVAKTIYNKKEDAKRNEGVCCIATVKIEWEE